MATSKKSAPKDDVTPEELRAPLLKAMLTHAGFDGWGEAAMKHAASDVGCTPEMAELAYPLGPIELLTAHLDNADTRLMAALKDADMASMKIRDRITFAVRTRIEQAAPHRDAVQRGMATLALPQHTATGLKALSHTMDLMWRAAGDTATDYNWYTKRMTLAGVYMSTLTFWFADDSDDFADTWEFLDRRIEDVMKIETAKYNWRQSKSHRPSFKRFFDRLRSGPK